MTRIRTITAVIAATLIALGLSASAALAATVPHLLYRG